MRDFGVPGRLAAPVGALLPLGELAVAVALVPKATAWWGAIGALALLLLFVAGVAVNLARGKRPNCHCFGQLHSGPAGWPTLARNGALAAVAAFVAWRGRDDPGESAVAWLGDLSTEERVGAAAALLGLRLFAALAWAVVRLLRQNGRLLARLDTVEARLAAGEAALGVGPAAPAAPAAPTEGLPVGTPAPAFSLPGLHGETLTLQALRARGKPVMLAFSDPNCGPCNALLPDLGRWQRDHADRLAIALISRGTPEANRAKSAGHGLAHVLIQENFEVAEAYRAIGTPAAVLVGADGAIGSPVAVGAESVRALVARTIGAPSLLPAAAAMPST